MTDHFMAQARDAALGHVYVDPLPTVRLQLRKQPRPMLASVWSWRIIDDEGTTIQHQPPQSVYLTREQAVAAGERKLDEVRAILAGIDLTQWHDAS